MGFSILHEWQRFISTGVPPRSRAQYIVYPLEMRANRSDMSGSDLSLFVRGLAYAPKRTPERQLPQSHHCIGIELAVRGELASDLRPTARTGLRRQCFKKRLHDHATVRHAPPDSHSLDEDTPLA